MDHEVNYHGQAIPVNVSVTNNSRKTVKSIQVGQSVRSVSCTDRVVVVVGKIQLDAALDKEVFYHGEDIPVHIGIREGVRKGPDEGHISP